MKIKEFEIKSVVSNTNNYILAHDYYHHNCIKAIRMEEKEDQTYDALAISETNNYENNVMVKVNDRGRIIQYGCDCPYCDGISGCAHVGALLYKINTLDPKEFPYHYEQVIDDPNGNSFQNDLNQLKKREVELREQRKMEYDNYIRQQELKQIELRKGRSRDIIEQEKNHLFNQIHPIETREYQVEVYDAKVERDYYSDENFLAINLRVGKKKKYVIKNIGDFFQRCHQDEYFRYGKDLAFVHNIQAFDQNAQALIAILEESYRNGNDYGYVTDRRALLLKGVYLDRFYTFIEENEDIASVLKLESNKMYMQIQIDEKDNGYEISLLSPRRSTKFLQGESHIYELKNKVLTRKELDGKGKAIRLFEMLKDESFLIDHDDMNDFYRYVLMDCMSHLKVKRKDLLPDIKEETSIQLYADVDESDMIRIDLDCFIDEEKLKGFSDAQHKPPHLEMLEHYIGKYANVIDYDKQCAYLDSNDEGTITFMKEGLPYLSNYCEVFASELLQHITQTNSINMQVGVHIESDLLCVDFDSSDMQRDEIYEVLKAYRRKRKYHRLRDGRLLYLECEELAEMNYLMDDLGLQTSDLQAGSVKMPLYRSFYLQEQMENRDANLEFHRKQTFDDFMSHFDASMLQEKAELPDHFNSILRDYQKDGYQWMKRLNTYHLHGILADDMGLGKTLQVLALIESEKSTDRISMIIAPSSLLLNWKDEVEKFSAQLTCACIMGSAAQRGAIINDLQSYDMVITSYDYIRRDVTLYENVNFHYIILDEAQYIKNQKTKNAICVKMLKGNHRLALTGTPIENSLAELWSIFDFLLPGYLYHYHYFQTHYERDIVTAHNEEKQKKLKTLVEPFILRRTKKEVLQELPDKIETTLTISFEEEEKKIYMGNLAQASKELAEKLSMEKPDRFAILAMLTRLRQICCEPRLIFDNILNCGSKLKGCMELIQSLKENHQRVLLFSSFTSMLDMIAEELTKNHIHYLMLTGKTDKEERRKLVNRFQSGSGDVFLISLKAGGTGLNLTAAQAVIHYDPWWNVSAQNQASDRAYRIGQTENVTVYKLIMEDSIEKKIQDLQVQKKNLADTFVEGNEGSIQNMQLDDIVELFKQ